jgi:hypothetical protein
MIEAEKQAWTASRQPLSHKKSCSGKLPEQPGSGLDF